MGFKLLGRTIFPAQVNATSPLTLLKVGLAYTFGLDVSALLTSIDPLYAKISNNLSDLAFKYTAKDNISIHGADIASAATVNLETATGDLVDVTGTTTITAITLNEGHERTVRFTGILTLTNGASLVLPSGASITTAAGDFAVFRGYATGVVRCIGYQKASGAAVVGGTGAGDVVGPSTATDNAVTRFSGTTGKLIQNSLVTVDGTGKLIAPGTIESDTSFVENNSTTHAYRLQARTLVGLGFPAPTLQPVQNNSVLAFDLMPLGSPTESSGNGFTWIDVCDADILTSNTNPTHSARLAITSTAAVVGSFGFNGATALPLAVYVNGVLQATFNTSNNLDGLATITRTGGVSVQGTNTSNNAAAGYFGEYIQGDVLVGSAVALTTATPLNVCSIALTAGDWDVTAQAYLLLAATTSYTNFQYSISGTSGTINAAAGQWQNFNTAAVVPGNIHETFGSITKRVSIAAPLTVFLVAQSAFTVSTASVWGTISARRVR